MTNLDVRELQELGLAQVGRDVHVDRTARIFGAERVSIGSHVRIDCFVVITAGPGVVTIGDHVHLGVGVSLFGTKGIAIAEFASLSGRVAVYSTSDDFVDGHLSGPTVPDELRKVHGAPVSLGPHTIVGAGSVILPGVRVGRGAAVGALSLVKGEVAEGELVAGVPSRPIGRRDLERLGRLEAQARAGE
jgi:acetyltransferase-like isoleucine patch superfamily enzyme